VRFGTIFPLSSDSPYGGLGAHHLRAVEQAVADVRTGGGPLGRDVELLAKDSEVSGEAAIERCEALREAGAVGVVGGLVSDVSLALAEHVSDNPMVQVSQSSTTPALAERGYHDDTKYAGRTAPNDIQQASVMAKVLDDPKYVDADDVAVLYLDDAFGNSLAAEVRRAVEADVTAEVPFEPGAQSYDDTVSALLADDPDGVAVVSSPGSTEAVLGRGLNSDYDGEWVLSAGLIPGALPNLYTEVYGATVASQRSTGAQKLAGRLDDIAPLAPYTRHAYDALFLQALAVERAGEATPEAVAENLRAVSGGRGHTVTVGEFDRARELLDAGREINYEGASSSVDLNAELEPLSPYVVQQVSRGTVNELELVKSSFFEEGDDE
jgi:ABC-type branched-subunit amino acid transport system substrate-binding protein